MSTPLSLRICCIAAMAPALTEAATQPTRVKLPLCLSPIGGSIQSDINSTNHLLSDATKQLVIERSSGLRSNHIGLIDPHDINHYISRDTLEGEASLISTNGDPTSKYLSIGGKLLDLGKIVNFPHVQKLPVEGFKGNIDRQVVKMSQPSVRLYVNGTNGTNNMTISGKLNAIQGDVTMAKHCNRPNLGLSHIRNGNATKEKETVDPGQGSGDTITPIVLDLKEVNCGSGDAQPVNIQHTESESKHQNCEEMLNEVSRRQHLQERRSQRLLRRLRRLQVHQSKNHIKDQLGQFVDYHHHNLETMAQSITTNSLHTSAEPTPDMLHSDKLKSLSTASLVTLVRRLQSSQSPMTLKTRLSSATQSESQTSSVLRMSRDVRAESEKVSDQLLYHLHHFGSVIDSDVTESSSGGESGDEYGIESVRRPDSPHIIGKSASWHWSRDRSEVAARWTWLQAQVSDLEYRIRTQSDIYRQLRSSKGAVQLTDARKPTFESPANLHTIISNMDRQTSKITQSLVSSSSGPFTPGVTPCGTPVQSPARTRHMNGLIDDTDSACQAARCRPVASLTRKRRLFRTCGLYLTSRKAARLSSVHCYCQWPVQCVICQGRYQYVQSVDNEVTPRSQKLGVLDSAYHPVLSFPEDVPLPLIMGSLVQTVPSLQSRTGARSTRTSPDDKPTKLRKKYARTGKNKKKKTAASLVAMKYKTRLTDRAMSPKQSKRKLKESTRGLSRAEMTKRKKLKLALKRERRMLARASSIHGSPCDSPIPPGSQKSMWWKMRKLEASSAYDIDNIVIPYSVASSTRVQKLEYKEIITPKWRWHPVPEMNKQEAIEAACEQEVVEDLSDDMFASRHVLCEVREKQRYLHFVLPTGRKGRPSMRTESGATTPDPVMSDVTTPEASTSHTPPATPLPLNDLYTRRRSSSASTRSRTQSACEERSRTSTPDMEDITDNTSSTYVQYWDPRNFPLSATYYQTICRENEQVMRSPPKKKRSYVDPEWKPSGHSLLNTPGSSRACSPVQSDSSQGDFLDEVSDPEWIGGVVD